MPLVPKQGFNSIPWNYRSVSLLPVISKEWSQLPVFLSTKNPPPIFFIRHPIVGPFYFTFHKLFSTSQRPLTVSYPSYALEFLAILTNRYRWWWKTIIFFIADILTEQCLHHLYSFWTLNILLATTSNSIHTATTTHFMLTFS